MLRPLSILTVVLLGAAGGCGRGQSGTPKVQRVKVGMTVQQVEQVLGKPRFVGTLPNDPRAQLRMYPGDGDHTVNVEFNNGTAVYIDETAPRHYWPPVG